MSWSNSTFTFTLLKPKWLSRLLGVRFKLLWRIRLKNGSKPEMSWLTSSISLRCGHEVALSKTKQSYDWSKPYCSDLPPTSSILRRLSSYCLKSFKCSKKKVTVGSSLVNWNLIVSSSGILSINCWLYKASSKNCKMVRCFSFIWPTSCGGKDARTSFLALLTFTPWCRVKVSTLQSEVS